MPQLNVSSRAACDAEPAQLWAHVRDFCAPWHPAIATMTAQQNGKVRAFTVHGEDTVYRERLTYLSESDRTISYTHLAGISGVESYDATLRISAKGGGGSNIEMGATLTAPSPRAENIATGTQMIFDAGVAAICDLVSDTNAPEMPLMTRAQNNVTNKQITGVPTLGVSATNEGASTLLLFLHGIGGNRTNWNRQLECLPPHIQGAALDLRGYGGSHLGNDPSTIDAYCADVLRVFDESRAQNLILCGLSYGAWIATSFAMRHPEKLSGLILAAGCTGMSEASIEEQNRFRQSREIPLNAGQSPADFAAAVVDVIAGPDASTKVRQELLDSMAAIPVSTYRDALHCFTNPAERFDFERLSMPVLFMTGEHDRLAPPPEIRGIAERVHEVSTKPDVQFEVIEGAGHVCNLEQEDRFNQHLLTFLSRLPK